MTDPTTPEAPQSPYYTVCDHGTAEWTEEGLKTLNALNDTLVELMPKDMLYALVMVPSQAPSTLLPVVGSAVSKSALQAMLGGAIITAAAQPDPDPFQAMLEQIMPSRRIVDLPLPDEGEGGYL